MALRQALVEAKKQWIDVVEELISEYWGHMGRSTGAIERCWPTLICLPQLLL